MNIFKKITFLWKVCRRTLSIEEFSYLLNLSKVQFLAEKPSSDNKAARWLLKKYFKHPLCQSEIDSLVMPGNETAQEDWLKSLKQREAGDVEKFALVINLPWHLLRRFPFELSEGYLAMLFGDRNPQKIIAYCREYALPDIYEKMLIEKYQQSLTTPDEQMQYSYLGGNKVNGWAKALEVYLDTLCFSGKRFATKAVQQRLLELNDEKIIEKLVLRCNIAENFLHADVIWQLIEEGKVDAIRLLLRESYIIAPPITVELMEKKMPQVLALYYIARYRRNFYLKEQKCKIDLKTQNFSKREEFIVSKHKQTLPEDMDDFVDTYVKPWLDTFGPCMCAYLAYWFPDLAEKISENLPE